MKTLERYIIRRSAYVFAMTIAALTGVVWATQALRQLDLVTSKGQTIVDFIAITMLAMPFLIAIVAPFALMIALVLVLNALSGDSELIVIDATGGSRFLVLKPILIFATGVMALAASMSLYFSPMGLAELREEITRVRADLVANVVKPGRFITVENGLTFHIRNRSGKGELDGLLLHDTRDPETAFTYQAERGRIEEVTGKTLLLMQNGTIQRRPKTKGDISIVRFQSYAFDLSNLIPEASEPVYKASERSTANLMAPESNDAYALQHPDKLAAELHERFSQPLYCVAFALTVFAFLGKARTTRQSRGLAVLGAISSCVALRTAGFAVTAITGENTSLLVLLYVVPITGMALATFFILRDAPASSSQILMRVTEAAENLTTRVLDRLNGHSSRGAS
ncbi:lipopolysaccharide export system permease protein [Roseibium hamelinense]|uniref:Lipopolysaccharide export system permease protein n=1 Tax=Roseibium hamelinense TaxID=150831 RepID=A0A562TIT9_9HYPH|nr:LPS export ABC transporter permease LptF [Roseibium hamelinense]MTI42313.1 LPS export ABC transporter permease LptF [Roseibium hamelinense]TWI93234.1 lipopolysaccharide export system permease protein [Roseibium hamelinense]